MVDFLTGKKRKNPWPKGFLYKERRHTEPERSREDVSLKVLTAAMIALSAVVKAASST